MGNLDGYGGLAGDLFLGSDGEPVLYRCPCCEWRRCTALGADQEDVLQRLLRVRAAQVPEQNEWHHSTTMAAEVQPGIEQSSVPDDRRGVGRRLVRPQASHTVIGDTQLLICCATVRQSA